MSFSTGILVAEKRRKKRIEDILKACLVECVCGKGCSCTTKKQHEENLVRARELGITPQNKAVPN
jgi:hypothetical protein